MKRRLGGVTETGDCTGKGGGIGRFGVWECSRRTGESAREHHLQTKHQKKGYLQHSILKKEIRKAEAVREGKKRSEMVHPI